MLVLNVIICSLVYRHLGIARRQMLEARVLTEDEAPTGTEVMQRRIIGYNVVRSPILSISLSDTENT